MLLYNTYLCILLNDGAELCCYLIHISAFYLMTMPSYGMLLYNTYLCILLNDDAQLCCYIIHISAFYLMTMPSYVVI
jgi:hypothetical protein